MKRTGEEIVKECRQAYCIPCTLQTNKANYYDPVRKELKRKARVLERLQAIKRGKALKKVVLTPEQKEARCASLKRWRNAHREDYQALDRLYKRMKRNRLYRRWWPLIVKHYGGCCGCGSTAMVVDHVIPLDPKKPETNSLANLQPLCRSCNAAKGGLAYDHRPDKGAWIVSQEPLACAPFVSDRDHPGFAKAWPELRSIPAIMLENTPDLALHFGQEFKDQPSVYPPRPPTDRALPAPPVSLPA
jgi:5-methylcytosine-specific restriction endonuclease McrA